MTPAMLLEFIARVALAEYFDSTLPLDICRTTDPSSDEWDDTPDDTPHDAPHDAPGEGCHDERPDGALRLQTERTVPC